MYLRALPRGEEGDGAAQLPRASQNAAAARQAGAALNGRFMKTTSVMISMDRVRRDPQERDRRVRGHQRGRLAMVTTSGRFL